MSEAPISLVRITDPVIMIFPALVVPQKYKLNGRETDGEPAYSASFVLPAEHPAVNSLKASVVAVCKEKWPGRDFVSEAKAGKFMLPFVRGDAMIEKRAADLKARGKEYKGENDFMKGALVLKASTKKYAPNLGYWDPERNGWVDLDDASKKAHENKFYFGAEVLVEINLSAYNKVNSLALDGVKAYLQKVYATGKGKRLIGGESGSSVFASYQGHVSEQDPTAGMVTEILF